MVTMHKARNLHRRRFITLANHKPESFRAWFCRVYEDVQFPSMILCPKLCRILAAHRARIYSNLTPTQAGLLADW